MSEGPDGGGDPARRRRRRRRPRGDGERGPAGLDARRPEAGSRAEPRRPEAGSRAEPRRPEAGSRAEPRRPEPGSRPEPRPRAESPARPEGGPRPGPGRERRRRRGRDSAARQERERGERPALRPPAPPTTAALDEVDRGWDDPADLAQAGPATGAPRPSTVDDDAPRASERWGDDSDAPTPEVSLAPDLPPDPPADDPDPVTAELDAADELEVARGERGPVQSPVGVKFTGAGKIYLFDAGDDDYQVGEEVVVDTDRGPRVGMVAVAPGRREVGRGALRRVLRRPSRSDQRSRERNTDRAAEILRAARDLARDLEMPVKVFRAELSLGGGKAVVYFSTEDKVDLRRLGRELSQALHLRVDMRQTGVRDEAKMVGGIGSCGQELCCSTWLPAFVPVSIKNAKDQGLVLNPSKVSGQCGRLKCCLVYEQETYAAMRKGLPKLGKRVVTAAGEGRVVEVDVLRQRVRVSLVHGEMQVLPASEVQPLFPSQPPGSRDPSSTEP